MERFCQPWALPWPRKIRQRGNSMKTFVIAIAVASGALFSLSAEAAPLTSDATAVQGQVKGAVVTIRHCRSWSGGWRCGGDWDHGRRWSHRRRGSWWR
jgi:hypothetical protein